MDTFITKQDATIVELSGSINTKNSQGEQISLNQGDTLKQNTAYSFSAGSTFTLQYSDGSTITQDELTIEPMANDVLQTNQPAEIVDPEIAALQAQILSGEDPTENLPDTAAGETAQAGNEGGGYVAVGRMGDETIANAGHDTAGFEQIELQRIEELPVFLTEFARPQLFARAVTLYEKHLEQGSEPQASQLSQAESVSVNVQAGINELIINGVAVFVNGDFVGPVSITTQYGVLTISNYDPVDSVLTYSYSLVATLDHSDSDTLSELFLLQVTDNQGVQTTALVTANVVDDAPSGLDDINAINQNNLDGVAGNVLQNDTLGADLAAVTQITNSENSTDSIAGNTAISGVYGSLVIAADGSYSYELNNQLSEIQSLAQGEQIFDTFNYQLTDSDGDSVVQALVITITGENDAPEITTSFEDALGNVTEAGVLVGGNIATDGIPQASGTLTADDIDNGAVLTWQLNDDPQTPYGNFTLNEFTGEWLFTLDNELANSLAFGDTETETFNITVTDEFGLSDTQMVTITINGTNDIPELAVGVSGSVTEDDIDIAPDRLVATGVITATDVDNNDILSLDSSYNNDINWQNGANATLSAQQISDIVASFSLDNDEIGWTYNIDNDLLNFLAQGDVISLSFDITVTDINGAFDTETVTITINGTNDDPTANTDTHVVDEAVNDAATVAITGEVIAGMDHGGGFADLADSDPENQPLNVVQVENFDGDIIGDGDTAIGNNVVLVGEFGTLTISSDGSYSYLLDDNNTTINALDDGDIETDTFTYWIEDADNQQAMATLTITINGSNDGPTANADTHVVDEAVNDAATVAITGEVIAGMDHGGGFADLADSDPENQPLNVVQVENFDGDIIGDGDTAIGNNVVLV
ncbi:retention module-containing protein, partial [Shewanella sp. MBTL60-112-B1]|uniref:retention module-containing protein n=3 Tax=unclassified Shewanella TaxID=196818 RepID=UPI00218020FA